MDVEVFFEGILKMRLGKTTICRNQCFDQKRNLNFESVIEILCCKRRKELATYIGGD